MKLSLAASGGTYVTYLRATSNALAANGNTGTFYAIQVQNPTFSQNGAACTATLLINKSVAGSVTTLWASTIACSQPDGGSAPWSTPPITTSWSTSIIARLGFAADTAIQTGSARHRRDRGAGGQRDRRSGPRSLGPRCAASK